MRKSNSNNYKSLFFNYFCISAIGVILFLLLTTIFSIIYLKNPIFDSYLIYIELLALFISSVIVGILSSNLKLKSIVNGFITGIIQGIIIFLIILAFNAFSFKIQELLPIIICALISAISSVIKCNLKSNKRRIK